VAGFEDEDDDEDEDEAPCETDDEKGKGMKYRGPKKGNLQNGFVVALGCSVALAFLFPGPGAKGGWLHPDLLNNAGIASSCSFADYWPVTLPSRKARSLWARHLRSANRNRSVNLLSRICGL